MKNPAQAVSPGKEGRVSTEEPWTIKRLLDWTTNYLQGRGVESPRLEAQLLLAKALECNRTHLYTHHDTIPPDEKRTQFKELVQRRVKGVPVAHLLWGGLSVTRTKGRSV